MRRGDIMVTEYQPPIEILSKIPAKTTLTYNIINVIFKKGSCVYYMLLFTIKEDSSNGEQRKRKHRYHLAKNIPEQRLRYMGL